RLHLPASSKSPDPHHPLTDHPEWPKHAHPADQLPHLAPPPAQPGFRPPASPPSGPPEPPNTRPTGPQRAANAPIPAGMPAPEAAGCSRGAQGTPPHHHPAYSPRSGRGSGFKGGRPRRPGDAETATRHPLPSPVAPPRSAAPDRPAGPLPAFAARLNPRPARRRTRLRRPAPPLPPPSPPV